ncbi:hypothetical protein MTO96_034470 [Rhipicephalus appendiculatus]
MCLLETAPEIVGFGILSLGSKSCILRYTTAAKWQALLCLCWQLLSFFVAAAHSEVHNENGVHRMYIKWPNGTSATVTVTNTSGTAISVAGIIVYIALLPIYFLRVKNVRLFKAALEGPGTVGSFLNVIYYAAATVMALWLILSVLTVSLLVLMIT